jgi:hypothetical protein
MNDDLRELLGVLAGLSPLLAFLGAIVYNAAAWHLGGRDR